MPIAMWRPGGVDEDEEEDFVGVGRVVVVVDAVDDDELTHLSYADDCLALLNACVIDCCVFCHVNEWINGTTKYNVRKILTSA